MPRQAAWLSRIPQILQQLQAFPGPVVDRACLERLFGVGRRRAQQLLKRFGGWQSGRTYLIERDRLAAALEELAQEAAVRCERQRRERLASVLAEAARDHTARGIAIPGSRHGLVSWPNAVTVAAGVLRIPFETPEDCVGRLWALVQAIAADYEGFRRRLTSFPAIQTACKQDDRIPS